MKTMTRLLILLILLGSTLPRAAEAAASAGAESPEATMPFESSAEKPTRARELGVAPGVLSPGPLNAITDVEGVRVGHFTLREGSDVRTGATAVLPHGGNLFQEKVPASVAVGNGFGKLAGTTQILELGEIETPIVLTNTLSVAQGIEAVLDWTLRMPGNDQVRSVNAVVGETNDGYLNDIRSRALRSHHILQAIESARPGPVEEGAVGAGTGTRAFGWKGGIGTSSRRLSAALGGYTVGVLVQSNYGGVLEILGSPIGRRLGRYELREFVEGGVPKEEGSIMIVVATDAPLSDRNLRRLASRSLLAVSRTGSSMGNGSGDYALAFSAAPEVRRTPERRDRPASFTEVPNALLSPLFRAAMEASEEAIYNSLFMAESVEGHRGRADALPVQEVLSILRQEGRLTP